MSLGSIETLLVCQTLHEDIKKKCPNLAYECVEDFICHAVRELHDMLLEVGVTEISSLGLPLQQTFGDSKHIVETV
jgi:hypothetical protein